MVPKYLRDNPPPKRITYNELLETFKLAGLTQRRAKMLADWIMTHGLERRSTKRNGEPEPEQEANI
jgi:hypothetical protein